MEKYCLYYQSEADSQHVLTNGSRVYINEGTGGHLRVLNIAPDSFWERKPEPHYAVDFSRYE